jgi:hypothetical protein
MRLFLTSLAMLFGFAVNCWAQETSPCRIEEQQCQELLAYRQFVPNLVNELNQLKAMSVSKNNDTTHAYDAYIAKFYAQASDYRDIRMSMYRWQERVATGIVLIVSALTVYGVGLATYQLVTAMKLGKAIKDAKIEISATKLVATTSSVGLIVLFLSLAFFAVFAKLIFPVISGGNQIVN